ncbi:MAG TPA: family 20 glycosylhydrolase [Terriglobia bacterium]|nr:family 20 glycosylhydrolase [Terriglobia bacterium]
MKPKTLTLVCGVLMTFLSGKAQEPLRLMPWPAEVQRGEGYLIIDKTFRVSFEGYRDELLERAATRLVRNLSAKTGLSLLPEPDPAAQTATLRVRCDAADANFLNPQADESYRLEVTPQGAELHAHGPAGVLRGMASFFQLVGLDQVGFRAPAVKIVDRPRLAWRGLMLDVARHFLTLDTLKRNLDAMELVKMNVLELHLSDGEGFRVESKVYPKLQQAGSNGDFYTQQQIRELVAYARDRGVRVVPEIEMPGHCKAILVGYPELAAAPGPYVMGPDLNVMNGTLDPTREEAYQFLSRLLEEMCALFPDPYFHTGGDEVNGVQWAQSASIQAFMKARGLKDKHELQAYFTERVRQILARNGKTMVGWDEVLQPNLAKDVVVQAWRSSKMVERSAGMGHTTLVSAGYYLDYNLPAAAHYGIDPFDSRAQGLPRQAVEMVKGTPLASYITDDNMADDSPLMTPEEEKRIAGGIACMWGEFVWNEKEEMMVWPRVGAIAERLWSPAQVKDVALMYRRLEGVDADLQFLGLRHHSNQAMMLQRLAGEHDAGPLATLAEAVEPVKNLARFAPRYRVAMATGQGIDNTVVTTRFVDALPAESLEAVRFHATVRRMLAGGEGSDELRGEVRITLARWRDNDMQLQIVARDSFPLPETTPASQDLKELAEVGLSALALWESKQQANADWLERQRVVLARHRKIAEGCSHLLAAMLAPPPPHELMSAIAPAIEELVNAAATGR